MLREYNKDTIVKSYQKKSKTRVEQHFLLNTKHWKIVSDIWFLAGVTIDVV